MPQLMSSVQNGYAKNANQMFVLKGEGNKIVPMSLMKGMPMASLSFNTTLSPEYRKMVVFLVVTFVLLAVAEYHFHSHRFVY